METEFFLQRHSVSFFPRQFFNLPLCEQMRATWDLSLPWLGISVQTPFWSKMGEKGKKTTANFLFQLFEKKIPIFQWKGFHIRMSFNHHHMTKKLIIIYEMAREESSVMFPFLLSPPPLILPSFSSIQIIKTVYCPSFKDNFPTIGAYWGYAMIAFLQSKLLHNCTIWYKKKRTKIDCWLKCILFEKSSKIL